MDAFTIISTMYPDRVIFLDIEDPFWFLSAVMLSAQTTDKRVMETMPFLIDKYADAHGLAVAKVEELEELIRPLGFFRMKAKNLIGFAKAVEERGSIPETIEELIKLPGIGRKSANCYLEHVLKEPAVTVDTHFKRVAYRLGYTDNTDPEKVEMDIKRSFPSSSWSRLSAVLNAYGRDVCHSKNPSCQSCLVRKYCKRPLL